MAHPAYNKGKGKAVAWLREHVTYAGDSCLIWPFARITTKGYGTFGYNGRSHYAHRFMCELVNGPPPTKRHQAGHTCGLGHEGCVHPLHLKWKTNAQNQRDRRTHGTSNKSGRAKRLLTFGQIAEIRALKGRETQRSLANRFGVKPGAIEYWQKHDRDPVPPGTSQASYYRRRRREAAAMTPNYRSAR